MTIRVVQFFSRAHPQCHTRSVIWLPFEGCVTFLEQLIGEMPLVTTDP